MTRAIDNPDLIARYARVPGAFDEMFDTEGGVRAPWAYFSSALQALGPGEFERRRGEAQRLLQQSGMTYNVYDDPRGRERPWALDPVPLLIGSEEWSEIESGLNQRAELLNLILADIYGPRELIRKGLLPMELVYAHGGFLRACHDTGLPGPRQLITYAADLARGPDGQMWVMADKTQAPSGAGYALANRTVMSRILPSLFRDSQVHRLSLFFQTLRNALAALSPQQEQNPRIVILTPGPHNETYSEHAFLAGYLGYTLVQGDDLTVRDGRVWLRSLNRLEPVDIILRRVDGAYCDPLELKPESRLGVPGLVEAVRRGNVAVANPLGSSVLENPALMAFLPAIAEHLLGQPLRLPTAASWWCGQAKEMGYVLDKLENLVIKMIHPRSGERPVFGAALSHEEREQLRARIRAHPHLYVGQEALELSLTPTWTPQGLAPRRTVLRSYLVTREDGYVVMPGGLTRVAEEAPNPLVSNQSGAISKDTWVLASEPEKQVSLWPQPRFRPALSALRGPLPGGAADNLFWMGRYAERSEELVRLLRTALARHNDLLEFGDADIEQTLHRLLDALAYISATPAAPGGPNPAAAHSIDARLRHLILEPQAPGTLVSNLHHLEGAAYRVRDRLSRDTLRVMSDVSSRLLALEQAKNGNLVELRDELDTLLTTLAALSGLATESMQRGQDWLFLDMGRRLERAQLITALIRAVLVQPAPQTTEDLLLESLLRATESLTAYRRDFGAHPQIDTVLEVILLDGANPRSLGYQLQRLQAHLDMLPGETDATRLGEEARLILDISTLLRLTDTHALALTDPQNGTRADLNDLLMRMDEGLRALSETLTRHYFTDPRGPQQLQPAQAEPAT